MNIELTNIYEIGLSRRSANGLHRAGINNVGDLLQCSRESLTAIRNLGVKSVDEILRKKEEYEAIIRHMPESGKIIDGEGSTADSLYDYLRAPQYQAAVRLFVEQNDEDIANLGLSRRATGRLLGENYSKLSDIILLSRNQLLAIRSMGALSVDEIEASISAYFADHEARIIAFCNGDRAALWSDDSIRDRILLAYQKTGFGGLSIAEMRESLSFSPEITDGRLIKILDGLVSDGELKYVDGRYYRIYAKFCDYVAVSTALSEREREVLEKRLAGESLELIGQAIGLTRERVRQIIGKAAEKARNQYRSETDKAFFEEESYAYFYSRYAVDKKDAAVWFGLTPEIVNYLEITGIKNGDTELEAALDDKEHIEASLRLKIANYLNRDKLYLDGRWVDKKRASLEDYVIEKYCRENVTFNEFVKIYNGFLKEQHVEYDESVYLTEAVIRTRKNRLLKSRILLWKQNETFRYYDIDARDYTELLETIDIDAYENIELSTEKFVRDYPDVMKKYDIRDKYELHNLLRKIVPEGSYHDFHCSKMPDIVFGHFDRDAAIMEIIAANTPISVSDLAEKVSEAYGYDPVVVMANYLHSFDLFYQHGVYSVDQKHMSAASFNLLKRELTDDFYYLEEIRDIYRRIVPDADVDEINGYNLKNMGFKVYSNYALQHFDSADAYFTYLLTKDDLVDVTPARKRLGRLQMFSNRLLQLRKDLTLIQYEPGCFVNIRKVQQQGITKDMLKEFCDEVYQSAPDDAYFNTESIRKSGFYSGLFESGYPNLFFNSLLFSDTRLSYTNVYGNIIFCKGSKDVTVKSFVTSVIRKRGTISLADLSAELREVYGCRSFDKWHLKEDTADTEIYYDGYSEMFYARSDLYYEGLTDGAEDL